MPGSPGHPMYHLGPPKSMDIPCPPWSPQDSCVRAGTPGFHGHPMSRPGPLESHGHPLSPVSTPGTPGSLPGSHGHPMSLADTPRSPCPPGTPESHGYPTPMSPPAPHIPAGSAGVPVPHIPLGAPWVGAVPSGRQRPGVGDKGGPTGTAPRPAPFPGGERPAPAGPDGGARGEPKRPAPAHPLHPPRSRREGAPRDPCIQHLQSARVGSRGAHAWICGIPGGCGGPGVLGTLP